MRRGHVHLLLVALAPAAGVPIPTPELWRQLAALPYLAAQAMEGRKEELVGTLAQGHSAPPLVQDW